MPDPRNDVMDAQPLADGDDYLLGVKMQQHPAQVPAGYASAARNCRFTQGVADPRRGVALMSWTNKVGSVGAQVAPFTAIYGSGVFKDPNSVEWLIFAAEGLVYKTRQNNAASVVPLPAGTTITAPVTFTQCMNVLVMFRGESLDELVMDNVEQGFRIITQEANEITGADSENPTDGTVAIPPAARGIWMQNRLFLPYDTDSVAVSDFLNYTRYQDLRSTFRINQGDSESLVALHEYNENTLVCLKSGSVHIVASITADLSGITRYRVTDQYGCSAPESVVTVGKDVWFMANRRGVCSINQTEQNKVQGVDVPVSQDIEPLIARINWRYENKICAATNGKKVYFAVPLDAAEVVKGEIIDGESYSGGAFTLDRLIAGRSYRLALGANDTDLVNGATTITDDCDFVAASATVTLHGTGAVTASLRPLFTGVNNAVLVYDSLNQSWAGHDDGEAIMVQAWRETLYNGERRLFAVTEDGFIGLYEELFHDQVEVYERPPRTDLTLVAAPTASVASLKVNGGTTITSAAGTANAAGGSWAIASSLATAAGNLWQDSGSRGGFRAAASNPWSAPNTLASQITNGVRFTATDGVVPTVVLYAGSKTWFTVDKRGGVEKVWVDFELTTRGYATQARQDRKAVRSISLQVKTWNPIYSITAITDGVAERHAVLTNKTRDRTVYDKPWDAPAYDTSNANDDHGEPYRQDYSIDLPPGYTFTGDTPVNPDAHQESTEDYNVPRAARGRSVQFELTSSQGRVELHGVRVESQSVEPNRKGVLV